MATTRHLRQLEESVGALFDGADHQVVDLAQIDERGSEDGGEDGVPRARSAGRARFPELLLM
jgi:hypothetical protein